MNHTLATNEVQPSKPREKVVSYHAVMIAASLVVIGTAVWFRIVGISYLPGLNGDEAWSGVQALKLLGGQPIAWRTPTGNPLNPFFFGPTLALHALFPPSIALLRSVSVASGILALGVNYWLCRRTFDLSTALVSTVLLAALPVNIAYSRFAWDSSQTLLATVLVLYAAFAVTAHGFSLKGLMCVALTFAAALVVHPTNVFLAPFVVTCCWYARGDRKLQPHWLWLGAALGGVTAGFLLAPRFVLILNHLGSLTDASQFVLNWERLISGATVYQFISMGAGSARFDRFDLVIGCLLVAAAIAFVRGVQQHRNPFDRCLGIGFGISLASFYLIAGPQGVEPHFERYALWSVAPATLLIARRIVWRLQGGPKVRRWTIIATGAAVIALLANFYVCYFRVMQTSGGESHLAFRTSNRDPKLSAFKQIEASSTPSKATWIVSANWWTRLPLEYFALGTDNIRVVNSIDQVNDYNWRSDSKNIWFVELAGSEDALAAEKLLQSHSIAFERAAQTDRSGRPVAVLFHITKNLRAW